VAAVIAYIDSSVLLRVVLRVATDADSILSRMIHADLDTRVLQIASSPMPAILGTLDALHLATAGLYREAQPAGEPPIVFATHDRQLAIAAEAMRFTVIGNVTGLTPPEWEPSGP
jgi:hypothetical protein